MPNMTLVLILACLGGACARLGLVKTKETCPRTWLSHFQKRSAAKFCVSSLLLGVALFKSRTVLGTAGLPSAVLAFAAGYIGGHVRLFRQMEKGDFP